MTTGQSDERCSRQQDIVPAGRLTACKATVIGAGAIGRQVALQLAAMGIPWLQIMDFDIVEASNLASQGYFQDDLGRPKVEATGQICHEINQGLELHAVNDRFKRSADIGDVLFCAVDRIETRRLTWESVKDKVRFFCDGRMNAEVLRVLTACDSASRRHYPATLFSSDEAFTGPCTARTTIYCASIAAGLMVAQFTKYLRQLPVDCDVQLNLLTSEMNIAGAPVEPKN